MHHFPASKGDSLCPLGFHPQVRWPTRCKRCFRDYKEHYHKKKEDGNSLRKDSVTGSSPAISNNLKNDQPRSWASSDNLYEGKLENELAGYQSTLDLVNLDDGSSAIPTFNVRLPRRRNVSEESAEKSSLGTKDDKNKTSTTRTNSSSIYDVNQPSRIQIKEVKSLANGPTNNDVQFVIQVKKKTGLSSPDIVENDVANDDFSDLKKNLKNNQSDLKDFKKKGEKLEKEKRIVRRKIPTVDNKFSNQKDKTSSDADELRSKLAAAETLCEELMDENESLKRDVRDMEEQIDEMHDNFREDQLAEYTTLKAELEQTTKNCRILSFKLRKAERRNEQVDLEKRELEKQLKQKVSRQVLIRSGSQDEHVQVPPDTSEIERDLREQLNFSEKEAANLRMTITRLENDNEVLLQQLKKLSERIRNKSGNAKDGIDEDELRLRLELNEQEVSPIRVNNTEKPKSTPLKKNSENDSKKILQYEQQLKKLKEDAELENAKNKEKQDELMKSIKKTETKSNKLKQQIETLEKNDKVLNETIKKNETTIIELQNQLKSEKAEIEKLKVELQSKSTELIDTKNLLSSAQELENTLNKKLKTSQSEKEKSGKLYEEKLKKLEIDSQSDREKLKSLKKDLDAKCTEVQSLKLRTTRKDSSVDNNLQSKIDEINKVNKKISADLDEATKQLTQLKEQHENSQKDFSSEKAKLELEKEALNSELQTIKQRFNNEISEKRELEENFESEKNKWLIEMAKIREESRKTHSKSSDNNGLDKMRFEALIAEKQSELDKYKKENESLSYQIDCMKRESDEFKSKLDDYEKVNKIRRSFSADTTAMEKELKELKKKLEMTEKTRKADVLKCKMGYEEQLLIVNNELKLLQGQIARFKREKDTYKNMLQSVQKSMGDLKYQRGVVGKIENNNNKANSFEAQVNALDDELSEVKLECSKLKTQLISDKSNYEVKILEMQTKINELEEEKILNSGKTKIAGRKTCMELSWQKEREEQQRLIQETSTLARDLRQTLFDVQKERDKERLEAKRKIEQLKKAAEDAQLATANKAKDLQCDLLELRDAHAKLRTTNERLKREKDKLARDEDMRSKSLSRTNIENSKDMSDILVFINTLKCLSHEVENLDDKQQAKADDKRDKLNNIVNSLLNISQSLFSQVKEFETEKLMVPYRRPRTDNVPKLTRQRSLNRRSLSLEQTSSMGGEQNLWQTDQGSMSSLRSANSDLNMSDTSINSDFVETKKKKGIIGKLKKLTKSKSVDEGNTGTLSSLLMGKKPSSLENLNNAITGIFRRGGSSSRSSSMERTKPPDSSSRQRPLMKMKSESPSR